MYCQNCGNQILDGTTYCHHCGGSQLSPNYDKNAGKPLLVVRPQFFSLSMLCTIFGWQVLMSVWAAIVFGLFGFIIIRAYECETSFWTVALIAAIIFFILTPFVFIAIKIRRYFKTEFIFYQNKMDLYEGMFNSEYKTIKYKDCIEINLQRSLLQRISGLGEIIISTAATGETEGMAKSGFIMFDIPNPDYVFGQIRYLMNNS